MTATRLRFQGTEPSPDPLQYPAIDPEAAVRFVEWRHLSSSYIEFIAAMPDNAVLGAVRTDRSGAFRLERKGCGWTAAVTDAVRSAAYKRWRDKVP